MAGGKWFRFSRLVVLGLFLFGLIFGPSYTQAVTVVAYSDMLSDSRPSLPSNHTLSWTAGDAVAIGDTVALTFAAAFDTASIVVGDIDFDASTKGSVSLAANCAGSELSSAVMAADVLTFTPCSEFGADIGSGETITVKIGTNAAGGSNQITNPAASTPSIVLDGSGYTGTGSAVVAIIAGVTTTATVSASLSVALAGNNSGSVNGAVIDVTTTTATDIIFDALAVGTPSVASQTITVSTNADGGYTSTIRKISGTTTIDVLNDSSNNCDGFTGNTATNADPQTWLEPTGGTANTDTCWYGYTTEDSSLGTGSATRFTSSGGNKWAPFHTSPYEVVYYADPISSQATKIGYEIDYNAFQLPGTYSGITEFITTAIF